MIFNQLKSQNIYDVDLINDSLKQNANSVIRNNSTIYEKISDSKYRVYYHSAITILNENGKQNSILYINYDKNSKVSKIKGNVYNEKGILVNKLEKKQIHDFANYNSYTLFSDNRTILISNDIKKYPITYEYEYVVDYNGFVAFNSWFPLPSYEISSEQAELIYKTKTENDFRYKTLNYNFDFQTNYQNQIYEYKWTSKLIKAIEFEQFTPNIYTFLPSILLSPNKISFEGTVGDFSSWENIGKWSYELIKNRNKLSDETIEKLKKLCDTIPNRTDKIRAVYEFMQNKTRYVNIAVGIGGFQPITANDVDQKGYGDCKALSNYTKSLLNVVEIEAFYTIIGSGKNSEILFSDFSSANQANHIILCVPNNNDTIWLECTNQNIPFGYISSSNSNRYALLVTEKGGFLTRTPNLNLENNLQISKIELELNDNQQLNYKLNSKFENYLYEKIFSLMNETKIEQEKLLKENILNDELQVKSYSISENKNEIPEAKLNSIGIINGDVSKTGNMLFIRPNFGIINPISQSIFKNRKQNLFIPFGYFLIDTLTLKIPENYILEYLPKNSEYNSKLGNYKLNIQIENNTISIIREQKILNGNYEKTTFLEIEKFFENIEKTENERIILKLK